MRMRTNDQHLLDQHLLTAQRHVRKDLVRLTKWMQRAIRLDDYRLAEHLLNDVHMPVGNSILINEWSIMFYALAHNNLSFAKLLRAYNGKLVLQMEKDEDEKHGSARIILWAKTHGIIFHPETRFWIQSWPQCGIVPVACYDFAGDSGNGPPVMTSWPAKDQVENFNHNYFNQKRIKFIQKFWNNVTYLRHLEAKNKVNENWSKLREHFQMRYIVLHWQMCAIEHSCAPGGRLYFVARESFHDYQTQSNTIKHNQTQSIKQ